LLEKTISNNQIKLDKAKNGNINSNKLEKFAERQEFLKEQLNNIILEKMKFEQFVANVKTDLEEAIEHAGKYLNLLQQEEQLPKEIEAEIEKLNQEDIVLHQKHSEKIEQITAAEEVKEPSEEEIKKLNQEKEIIATRRDKIKENLVILNQQLQEKQKIKQEKKFIEDNYLANKVLNDKIKDVHEKSKQISENIKKITNKKVKTEEKHKGKDKSKYKKPSQEQTL
jgi:hypothetical protein